MVGTSWVLGGGSAWGAVQVGQVAALRDVGRRPDEVVGVSVGALNGAVVALDPATAPERLAEIWAGLRRSDVLPLSVHPPWRSGAVFTDSGLRRLVDAAVGARSFADLVLPLRVLATDARTGGAVVLDSGPLAAALLASSAIPGLLPPVAVTGRLLVDGGAAPVAAVEVAAATGARELVTLRALSSPYARGALDPVGLWRQRRSAAVVRAALAGVPTVDLSDALPRRLLASLRFHRTAELIAAGYTSALTTLTSPAVPAGIPAVDARSRPASALLIGASS